jgi:DUF971 family protein
MSAPEHKIRAADLDETAKALTVTWGDGHASVFPLVYLRSQCPCASCRTEREEAKKNPFRVIRQVPSAEVAGIEPVGRYGLRFTWRDGHQAGIYTFEHLRELCPCEACRTARSETGTPYVHGIYIPK